VFGVRRAKLRPRRALPKKFVKDIIPISFRIKFDSRAPNLIFRITFMADIPPINPGAPQGAEPMKKSTGRVQPKKETVRINLPPKPTAAPTIKLPTLPPGGPTGASSGGVPLPPVPGAPALRSSAAPAAAIRSAAAAPAAATTAPRPVARPAAVATRISALDNGLAIAAAVLALAAIGLTVWMLMILNNALSS
jgi:hypothetical protein